MSSTLNFLSILLLFSLGSNLALGQEQTIAHVIAAKEYLRADNQEDAKLELDSALRISPKDGMANALMGDLMNEQGQYLKALLSYDKAILANTNDPQLYVKRAELHLLLNNHSAYITNDYDKAIALDPLNKSYYIKKAKFIAGSVNAQTMKPDLQAAADTMSDVIAFNPDDANLLYLRSKYLFGAEQTLGAMADINKAIGLEPTNDTLIAHRGYINFMIENYRGSYADYSRAIRINSLCAEYYEFRGHANYNRSQYAIAYNDYSAAIDLLIDQLAKLKGRITVDGPLNKELRGVLLYRGMSLVQDNKPYDGCEDFERAYEMGETKARNYMRKYCL